MNEYHITSTDSYTSIILDYIEDAIRKSILIRATNDYTLLHVDEPNVIGINERMVND